jgi:hypothetical protein
MSVLLGILSVIGGGGVSYGLTWRRENRRTEDAYRTPQREAIAGILSAGYELQLAVQAVSEMHELVTGWQQGTVSQETADTAVDNIGDQAQRAVLGVATAFNVGRITIVDAEGYEAMGRAFNEFVNVQDALGKIGPPTATNMGGHVEELRARTRKLNEDIFALVKAGQDNLSPVQTWRNKRKRAEVKKRLEAEYFKYPAEFG